MIYDLSYLILTGGFAAYTDLTALIIFPYTTTSFCGALALAHTPTNFNGTINVRCGPSPSLGPKRSGGSGH